MRYGRTHPLFIPAVVAAAGLSALMLTTVPANAAAYPAPPAGVHATGASATSLTVAANASANAQSYHRFASTERTDL